MALMGLFFGIGGSTASLTVFSIYGVLANKSLIWGIWGTLGFAILPGYLLLLRIAGRNKSVRTDLSLRVFQLSQNCKDS